MFTSLPDEKYISNFINDQFPAFYNDDAPLFIEFVKLYYEWLEKDNNEFAQTRNFLSNQDIDTVVDDYFIKFQNTYLFGLPEETLLNKSLLIKHIKDVYRSKGSIRGWKLLFRLLFNEELDFYIPAHDLLTPSEAYFYEPRYLEVNDTGNLDDFLGKTIIGTSSGITAIVESVVKEPINQNLVVTLYISNIIPLNGEFIRGEKIILKDSLNPSDDIIKAPTILGSLSTIEITNGGQNFDVGNILRIVHKDPVTNQILTTGVESELRVTKISKGIGSIYYDIKFGGSGYSYNPIIIQFNGNTDFTGKNASFELGPLINVERYFYNEDLLIDFRNVILNANAYGFNSNPLANISTPIIDTLSFVTKEFGTIASLTNIDTGNSYTEELQIKLKEGIITHPMDGTISYNSNSTIVIGNNTSFTTWLKANDVIICSNSANGNIEQNWVVNISNNTYLTVAGRFKNTTNNGFYRIAVNPFDAVAATGENIDDDGTIKGDNAIITGIPSIGKGIIAEVVTTDSGKGYHQDEFVKMYLYGAIEQPMVANGGFGYANGDYLVFHGGGTNYKANGIVRTDANGTITDADMTSFGSSYITIPTIEVKSRKGQGSVLTTQLGDYNRYSIVKGRTKLNGLGKGKGRWLSTKSFLNSDKYIQDSYYYQTYSYELKSPINLERYKDMFYNLFHVTGFEMFGKYYKLIEEKNTSKILYEEPVILGV